MLNFLVGNSAEYGKWNIFSRHKDKPVLTKVPPILSSTQEFYFLQKKKLIPEREREGTMGSKFPKFYNNVFLFIGLPTLGTFGWLIH